MNRRISNHSGRIVRHLTSIISKDLQVYICRLDQEAILKNSIQAQDKYFPMLESDPKMIALQGIFKSILEIERVAIYVSRYRENSLLGENRLSKAKGPIHSVAAEIWYNTLAQKLSKIFLKKLLVNSEATS